LILDHKKKIQDVFVIDFFLLLLLIPNVHNFDMSFTFIKHNMEIDGLDIIDVYVLGLNKFFDHKKIVKFNFSP
jgi:hypothetical protein